MSVFSRQGLSAGETPPLGLPSSVEGFAHDRVTASSCRQPVCSSKFDPHKDARAIVRLIQCSQCSLPLNNPLSLACGNSICRKCIPELHQRENISYLENGGRIEAFLCPVASCGREHVLADCSPDVTLNKIMEILSVEAAERRRTATDTPTLLDERLHWKNMVDSSKDDRVPASRVLNGGRLLATYTLAEIGELRYDSEVAYQTMSPTADTYELTDIATLHHLKEATKNELDCQVCYALIHDPVTTPCGHTFCRHCVARIIDHAPLCPICRRTLRLPPGAQGIPNNHSLTSLLVALCPDLVLSRAKQLAEENTIHGNDKVPMFVCTNAFPSMPTFLHVFEPRYRLMIRRAVESGQRRFGMIMYNHRLQNQGDLGPTQFMQYGTMLQINTVQTIVDGRSMLDTRGSFRFCVKSWDMLDGYVIANIEQLNDIPLAEEEAMEARETTLPPSPNHDLLDEIGRMPTLDLMNICTDFVRRMRALSAPWLRGAHFESYGEMPEDPALFPYWFASVLPISEEEKYHLLPTTSVRERLKITAEWVKRIEAPRW